MNDFVKYLNFKFMQRAINCDVLLNNLEPFSSIMFQEDFINCMHEFTHLYIKSNMLDKKQLSNFLSLISYIRQNCDLPKEKYISSLNEMIICVNQSDCSNTIEYLIDNYEARFFGHIPSGKKLEFDYESLEKNREVIKESNAKDYLVLMLLLELTDEDFNIALNDVVLDEYFLLSVNQIIYEVPDIIESKLFLERLKIVVTENIRHIRTIKNKDARKIIYKESRYYKKNL